MCTENIAELKERINYLEDLVNRLLNNQIKIASAAAIDELYAIKIKADMIGCDTYITTPVKIDLDKYTDEIYEYLFNVYLNDFTDDNVELDFQRKLIRWGVKLLPANKAFIQNDDLGRELIYTCVDGKLYKLNLIDTWNTEF